MILEKVKKKSGDKFSSLLVHQKKCLEGKVYIGKSSKCMNSLKGCLQIRTHETIVLCWIQFLSIHLTKENPQLLEIKSQRATDFLIQQP